MKSYKSIRRCLKALYEKMSARNACFEGIGRRSLNNTSRKELDVIDLCQSVISPKIQENFSLAD
jgi:hypothetical protein